MMQILHVNDRSAFNEDKGMLMFFSFLKISIMNGLLYILCNQINYMMRDVRKPLASVLYEHSSTKLRASITVIF